jgi:hypothetical protein
MLPELKYGNELRHVGEQSSILYSVGKANVSRRCLYKPEKMFHEDQQGTTYRDPAPDLDIHSNVACV